MDMDMDVDVDVDYNTDNCRTLSPNPASPNSSAELLPGTILFAMCCWCCSCCCLSWSFKL